MADETIELLATCTFGLEAVVVRELADLGYEGAPIGTGRVLYRGDARAICETNLWLRAADRVLVRVGSFPVGGGDEGFDALFEGVKGLAWERWIGREAGIPVSGRCVRSHLMSEPAVQRATKRAIVERLGRVYGDGGAPAELPETGAPVRVEVAVVNNVATLTLDTSGVGLHKRGYRDAVVGEAALRETLAAGLVLLSVWRPGRPLVDPFCGTGTIAIEAAMIGRSIAPGLNRSFDAERWVDSEGRPVIDPAMWEEARVEARAAIVPERLDPVIHASDMSEAALRMARANARAAGHGIEQDIQFLTRDVKDLGSTKEYGVIVTNPPYGVRLGEEREVEALYRSLPGVLRGLPTWSFHILSGRLDLERLFGQPATRRRKLYNSKIECGYFSYLGPKPEIARREALDAERNAEEGGADMSATEAAHLEDEDAAGVIAPASADGIEGKPDLPDKPRERTGGRKSVGPVFGGLGEREQREAGDFGRCLTNNMRHLRKYASRGVFCYRVYERDVTDVPLIVDRYESEAGEVWFHAAEYERPHERSAAQQADWFDLMRRTIAGTAGVPEDRVVMKEKHRQRGLTQHEKVSEQKRTMVVMEGGLRFEVNLEDYIDTGLFLDHRLTREMVRTEAAGKRVLNLFCYTGSFTTYAAAGGAASTVSVDLSNTYLEWAKRNLGLNGLYATRHKFERGDVMGWLRDAGGRGERFDLAVVDPPTFSNSKSTEQDWEVEGAHAELLGLLAGIMAPGGAAYFSTNFRKFKLDEGGVAAAGFTAREISHRTVPPEYRNKRVHRCWRLVRNSPGA